MTKLPKAKWRCHNRSKAAAVDVEWLLVGCCGRWTRMLLAVLLAPVPPSSASRTRRRARAGRARRFCSCSSQLWGRANLTLGRPAFCLLLGPCVRFGGACGHAAVLSWLTKRFQPLNHSTTQPNNRQQPTAAAEDETAADGFRLSLSPRSTDRPQTHTGRPIEHHHAGHQQEQQQRQQVPPAELPAGAGGVRGRQEGLQLRQGLRRRALRRAPRRAHRGGARVWRVVVVSDGMLPPTASHRISPHPTFPNDHGRARSRGCP